MSLRSEAVSGIIWTYAQQFGTQLLGFVVTLILARLVMPEEFGLIGMLSVFIGVATALANGGMTSSIIRSRELDEVDYSTVFIFNLVVSLVLYFVLYVCAPLISKFYRQPILEDLTRLYGLNFVFGSLGAIQSTILTKEMKFRKLFLISLPALIISSSLGIYLAFEGLGVWSLAWFYLSNTALYSFFLWITSNWKPTFRFSVAKFYAHFNYSYKLALSSILDAIFTNLYQIVIGRFYSAGQVGFYTRANALMMLPVNNISSALTKVAFPLFSKVQNDDVKLRSVYKQIMLMAFFVCTPVIGLMAVLAKPLIVFLFTEKWLSIVPIFQIIFIAGILYPLDSYSLNILKAKGRSDLYLKVEIIKKFIIVLGIAFSFFFGIYGLFYAQALSAVVALFINTYYTGRIIGYSARKQIADCFPVVLFTIASCCVAWAAYWLMSKLEVGNFFILALASAFGVAAYVGVAFLFKFSSLKTIKSVLKL